MQKAETDPYNVDSSGTNGAGETPSPRLTAVLHGDPANSTRSI